MAKLRYLSLLLGLTAALCLTGCIIEDDYDDPPDVDVDVQPDDPDVIIEEDPPDTIIIDPPPPE